MRVPPNSLLVVRALLHLVVFLGLCSFTAWIFIWLSPDYDKYTGGFGEGVVNLEYKAGPEKGIVVVYGYRLVIFLYQWCGILAAIFAVAILNALPKASGGQHGRLNAMRLRARAFAMWQAPLHKFWVHWCGGLSNADLLVIALYLALHASWFAWLVKGDEHRFDALAETGLKLPQSKALLRTENYALDFGVMLWPTLLMLFFPMAHVSFLSDWLGVHYAAMIRWHRWIGQGTMWILSIHGILYYIYWGASRDFWHEFSDWSTLTSINNLAGSIAWWFGIALWVTSISWMRRHFFEIFYRFHIGCFILFVIFSTIHYADAWTWWLPGLLVYAIDVVQRAGQALNATTLVAQPAEDGGYTTLEVKLAKGFKCRPNEEIFILVPQISYWQWHPFTIFEVRDMPHGGRRAVMHCKTYNAWTQELCRRSSLQHTLAARVVGPLGRNRDRAVWRDYSTVVLIGGGIGAIPVLAILKEILQSASSSTHSVGGPLKPPQGVEKVVFVWVSRHGSEFSLLDDEFLAAIKSCNWLDFKFYITTPSERLIENGLDSLPQKSQRPSPTWLPLTHHWASPLKLSPDRLAQPRLSGPILEILVAIWVFAGGFFGTYLASAYSANGTYLGLDEANTFYWKTGVVLLAVQTVMILGLPYAMVVLPVTFYRAIVDRRAAATAGGLSRRSPDSVDSDPKLSGKPAHASIEAFISQLASVSYERPQVEDVITTAVKSEAGHVGVFAGGPSSLRKAANVASYEARERCNLFGRLVHYYDESHTL